MGAAGRREGEQCVAVIGRRERNDLPLGRAPALDPVLPRELERRLDRLRAAAERVDQVEVLPASAAAISARQLLDRLVGERRAVQVADPAGLLGHRGRDLRHPMAKVGHEGAPRAVQIAPALGVEQPAALPAHDAGIAAIQLAVEDVGPVGIQIHGLLGDNGCRGPTSAECGGIGGPTPGATTRTLGGTGRNAANGPHRA